MKHIISLFILICILLSVLPVKGDSYYSLHNISTNNTTPKHSFDVLNYKLNLDIYNCFKTPYPRSFIASNHITFRVDSVLNSITLNAVNTSLVIDSVRLIGGPLLVISHTNNILTVTLDRTYNPPEIVNIIIYYRHNNITDNAFYVSNGVVFTDCPPEGARKWFPCWDKPSDKATVDITAKVPSNARLGSNGRLQDSIVTGDTIYYHWISRDPVATYLTVITGKVNYNMDRIYWHNISNPNDSIPVLFYYNSGENYGTVKNLISSLMTNFSNKFGDYAFEKGGFASIPNGAGFMWAGMENQTLITLCSSCWTENYAVHEFAHQWFGDLVTCGTWADVWINEGFATYCEAIWKERLGYAIYKNDVNAKANTYFSQNAGFPISMPQWAIITPHIDTLYNYGITYCKAAVVLHQLRYCLGDSVFFNVLNTFATDTARFKYKNSTTYEFNSLVNQISGQNYDWFFNAWIYQPNHPVYQNRYTIVNTGGGNWRVDFLANQIQTNAPFFPMLLTVKIVYSTGPDSLIKVMNNVNNQTFSINSDRQPLSVVFDPDNNILLKSAFLIGVNNLASGIPYLYELYQNYPNPFNPATNINFDLPQKSYVKLSIYDLTGKEVITLINEPKDPGKYSVSFNAENLSSGIYFYRLQTDKYSSVKKMVLIR